MSSLAPSHLRTNKSCAREDNNRYDPNLDPDSNRSQSLTSRIDESPSRIHSSLGSSATSSPPNHCLAMLLATDSLCNRKKGKVRRIQYERMKPSQPLVRIARGGEGREGEGVQGGRGRSKATRVVSLYLFSTDPSTSPSLATAPSPTSSTPAPAASCLGLIPPWTPARHKDEPCEVEGVRASVGTRAVWRCGRGSLDPPRYL